MWNIYVRAVVVMLSKVNEGGGFGKGVNKAYNTVIEGSFSDGSARL